MLLLLFSARIFSSTTLRHQQQQQFSLSEVEHLCDSRVLFVLRSIAAVRVSTADSIVRL